MNPLLSTPVLPTLAWGLIGVGILLWFWGTLPLLLRRSIFFRLHALTVADTIGSLLIVTGLLLLRSHEWPLLLLSLISLVLWNSTFSIVLSRLAADQATDPQTGVLHEEAIR